MVFTNDSYEGYGVDLTFKVVSVKFEFAEVRCAKLTQYHFCGVRGYKIAQFLLIVYTFCTISAMSHKLLRPQTWKYRYTILMDDCCWECKLNDFNSWLFKACLNRVPYVLFIFVKGITKAGIKGSLYYSVTSKLSNIRFLSKPLSVGLYTLVLKRPNHNAQ